MIRSIILGSLLISHSFALGEIGHGPSPFGNQQSEPEAPVALEDLGPSTIVQPPVDLPEGFTSREKRYLFTNLSTEDILFYSIAKLNEQGAISGGKSRYSWPPDDPPALAAGATEEIRFRGGNVDLFKPVIDFVLFSDGSSYGPDKMRSRHEYIAAVKVKYVWAHHLLEILETQGPDALEALLLRKIQNPNPALSENFLRSWQDKR